MKPYEIMGKEKIMVELKDSEDKISGAAIVPYPPGIPIIMPGEKICASSIAVIQYYIQANVTLLGINDGKIAIVE